MHKISIRFLITIFFGVLLLVFFNLTNPSQAFEVEGEQVECWWTDSEGNNHNTCEEEGTMSIEGEQVGCWWTDSEGNNHNTCEKGYPSVEILNGLTIEEYTITLQVRSNGCTMAEDFIFRSGDENPDFDYSPVVVYRVKRDPCKMANHTISIDFPVSDLTARFGLEFRIINQVMPSQEPVFSKTKE